MKYILAFSLLFVAKFTMAQSQPLPQASIIVETVSQLTDYSGSLTQANWTDAARGGTFNLVNATGLTVDNGTVFTSAKVGKVWKRDITTAAAINVRWFNAAVDGTTDARTAILAADALGKDVFFDSGQYRIATATTLASNLVFAKGASLKIEGLITINGSVTAAPNQRIFVSALTAPITFGRGSVSVGFRGAGGHQFDVYGEWFGALGTGDSTYDNSVYINQVLNSVKGFNVKFVGGMYYVQNTVLFPASYIENSLDFNGGELKYAGVSDSTKSVIELTANARNNRISNLMIDANNRIGYGFFVHSLSGIAAIKNFEIKDCQFRGGQIANVRLGDQTISGFDLDAYNYNFDRCVFDGQTGMTNVIIDGTNAVNTSFTNCNFGDVSSSTSRPYYHVQQLKGTGYLYSNCFFNKVDGWCIYIRQGTTVMNQIDSEEGSFLYVSDSMSVAKSNISITGLTSSDPTTPDNDYAIIARAGHLTMNSCYLGAGLKRVRVRVDDVLIANDVWLVGYEDNTTGTSIPKPGEFVLLNPQRCVIDGIRPAMFKPANGNPMMKLWNGSATDDLPVGYSKSTYGTCTITRDGSNGTLDAGFSTIGKYTAKIHVTSGDSSVSGTLINIDGLQQTVPDNNSNDKVPVTAVVTGYATNMVGITAPSISIIRYDWSGSSWSQNGNFLRKANIDSNGRFTAIVSFFTNAQIRENGFFTITIGTGVVGASADIYVDAFYVLNNDGRIYTKGSEFPYFTLLKSLMPSASDFVLNGNFTSAKYWNVGANWSLGSNLATHTTGSIDTLSQTVTVVPSLIQGNRIAIAGAVTGMTAGTLKVLIGGTVIGTISADGLFNYKGTFGFTDANVSFAPSTDFDGSLKNVAFYVYKRANPIDNNSEWTNAGVIASSNNGVLYSALTEHNLNPNRIVYGTAAPTAGDWKVGDLVINTTPSSTIFGYKCILTGTPGTWQAVSPDLQAVTDAGSATTNPISITTGSGVTSTASLSISRTFSGPSATNYHGIQSSFAFTTALDNSSIQSGIYSTVNVAGTHNVRPVALYGLAQYSGSNASSILEGADVNTNYSGSGTIAQNTVLNLTYNNTGSGTVTTGYNIHINTPSIGTTTTLYGIRVEEMGSAGFGLYAAGANNRNFINGPLGVGVNASTAAELLLGAGTTTKSPLKFTAGTNKTSATAGDLEYDGSTLFFTNGGLQRQELPQIQQTRVSTQFDKTSSTALSNITGLTATLVAGKTYTFEAILYTTSNVAGGVKFGITGSATATSIIYEGVVIDNNTNAAQTRATALTAAVGGATAVTNAYCKITGTITVNTAGTLTVQFAQNASSGTASSILVGSIFKVVQIP